MARLNCESGDASVTVTSRSPVCSIEVTFWYTEYHDEPTAGSRCRLIEATTSAAVSGVPSWKVTPSRIVYTHVVGVGCAKDSARAGVSV